jgi:hypothetical protein
MTSWQWWPAAVPPVTVLLATFKSSTDPVGRFVGVSRLLEIAKALL